MFILLVSIARGVQTLVRGTLRKTLASDFIAIVNFSEKIAPQPPIFSASFFPIADFSLEPDHMKYRRCR